MPTSPSPAEAAARVREYLRQRAMSRHHDPEDITGIHTDPDAQPACLKVSDLQALLRAVPPAPAPPPGKPEYDYLGRRTETTLPQHREI